VGWAKQLRPTIDAGMISTSTTNEMARRLLLATASPLRSTIDDLVAVLEF
jgi:hypothetical protein